MATQLGLRERIPALSTSRGIAEDGPAEVADTKPAAVIGQLDFLTSTTACFCRCTRDRHFLSLSFLLVVLQAHLLEAQRLVLVLRNRAERMVPRLNSVGRVAEFVHSEAFEEPGGSGGREEAEGVFGEPAAGRGCGREVVGFWLRRGTLRSARRVGVLLMRGG